MVIVTVRGNNPVFSIIIMTIMFILLVVTIVFITIVLVTFFASCEFLG